MAVGLLIRHKANIVILILQICGHLTGNYEVIRKRRQQPANMPQITDLDVSCEKTGMTVELEFSAPFNGIIFSKGHFSNPACRYVKQGLGRSSVKISVPLTDCGTQTMESSTDRLMIENTLIIQVDPMVQDSWDSARKITCDWQSKLEKMVTFSPFGVADLLQVAEIKFAGSGDNVRTRMELQFGRGPFAAPLEGLTKIGDELTVVIYVEDGEAGYDMLVKNCYAYDGANFKKANKIRLLNDHGCLFRPHQMEYFQRTFDTRNSGANIIAFARMNAFKFPDKMDIFLSCELELCKGGCDTHCEMDDYPIDIIDRLEDRPSSRKQPDTEAVPVTTFRPQLKKVLKGVKRRRKTKDFGIEEKTDDGLDFSDSPRELTPELMRLLEELGAQTEEIPVALAQRTDPPITEKTQVTIPDETTTTAKINSNNKMSFSTIFAGTHVISDVIPPNIINNERKFQPSQLLSATMDTLPSSFDEPISVVSRGDSGASQFSLNTSPEIGFSEFKQMEGLDGPFFQPENPAPSSQIIHFPADKNVNRYSNVPDPTNGDYNINTLQQQIQAEGVTCGPGSTDPRCQPQNSLIWGPSGFRPVQSTTPNLLTTTLLFTSPRSVELIQQRLAENPEIPKQVLLTVLDAPVSNSIARPPRTLNNRPRFGSRIAQNAQRFARFLPLRKRRDSDVDNIFAKETVNMVKNFQVVGASDLAFDTSPTAKSSKIPESSIDFESEICFEETAFYSGLLVACSLLLLSGLVSVCSIKRVRRYQRQSKDKQIFFGSQVLDSYQ